MCGTHPHMFRGATFDRNDSWNEILTLPLSALVEPGSGCGTLESAYSSLFGGGVTGDAIGRATGSAPDKSQHLSKQVECDDADICIGRHLRNVDF